MSTAQAEHQQHLIGGDWQPSAGGSTFERINPYTGEAVTVARIVADTSLSDELVARLAERAKALTTGDPTDEATQIGPLVDDASREHVLGLIDDARSKGARILAGGEDLGNNVISPAVVASVTEEMRLYSDESFGPVVAIIDANGEDDAVRIANDTKYGLSAAVFAGDPDRGMEVARRIDSGICHVNGSTVHDEPQMPFGASRRPVGGASAGFSRCREFTDLRWLTVQQGGRHYPI